MLVCVRQSRAARCPAGPKGTACSAPCACVAWASWPACAKVSQVRLRGSRRGPCPVAAAAAPVACGAWRAAAVVSSRLGAVARD